MQARILFVVSMLFLLSPWAGAQSGPNTATQPDAPQPPAQVWTANLGDEPVGVGDLVYISVSGSPELTRSYRVSNDGTLSLPLVPEPVSVAGMVPESIARAVSDALIRGRILVAPIVSAAVLEYKSRQVTVAGAVRSPVIIQATGDLKLLDAIARAQGFAPDAGPEVIVSRLDNAAGDRNRIRISIKDLLSGKDPKLNISLHGGEEIRVPDAPKLFVMGNVRSPGVYRLNETEGSSVLKAMALAQGTLPYSTKKAYVYRVVEGGNERREIAIALRDILRRKAPDVQLQANDILYVPQNGKLHAARLLDRITGFGETVGSGLIIRTY
jgi:polysaccharide biosynthesis/export protein